MKFETIGITLASLGILLAGHICHAQQAGSAPAAPSRLIRDLPVGPKVKPALAPLPPGAVRPTGWLLDWAKAAGDGLTGHLDQRHTVFADGWTGKHIQAVGAQPGGAGWPLEQCGYWLDGLVRLAYVLHDEKLIEKTKSRLDPVVNGVLKDGTSFVFWKPKSILNDTFNNWAHSHMGRALVAYYQATGDRRILDALVKVYREYPLPDMPADAGVFSVNVSGAVNLDPMLETYAMSGDVKVLENALEYARRKSFAGHVDRWVAGDAPNGHGVVYYENIRVPALLYPWTGDKRMLEATLQTLHVKDKRHGLPIGLTSSEEYLAGSGSTRSTETCNVACGPWTYHWLLRISGAGRHADRMEQVFFNAGPVPVSRDFQIMSYYQTPNRVGNVLPGENPRFGGYVYSEVGHGPLCCVGNCNRIVPNFIIHMWMATMDGGLAATLYGPCRLKTTVAGVPVTIDADTAYPFQQSIRMTVQPARPVSFPLHVRIPAWCATPKIQVNNRAVAATANENGFVVIKRQWNNGDRVTLEFPMQAKIVTGRETPFPRGYFERELAKLTEMNTPYACVHYGPLLFSLPIADENPNKCAEGAVWNYALNVDPRRIQRDIKVIRQAMPRQWNWQLDAPLRLTVPVEQFDWKPTPTQPLPKEPVTGGKPQTVTLVPYGCTKFRISMFPVSKRLWENAGDTSDSNR